MCLSCCVACAVGCLCVNSLHVHMSMYVYECMCVCRSVSLCVGPCTCVCTSYSCPYVCCITRVSLEKVPRVLDTMYCAVPGVYTEQLEVREILPSKGTHTETLVAAGLDTRKIFPLWVLATATPTFWPLR